MFQRLYMVSWSPIVQLEKFVTVTLRIVKDGINEVVVICNPHRGLDLSTCVKLSKVFHYIDVS